MNEKVYTKTYYEISEKRDKEETLIASKIKNKSYLKD